MKSALNLEQLKGRYELANRAEGKSSSTVAGYNQIISAFIRYLNEYQDNMSLSCFTMDIVRSYMVYLSERPKFQGHPSTPARGKGLARESIRDHVRTLKAFSSWLFTEGYIKKNTLQDVPPFFNQ